MHFIYIQNINNNNDATTESNFEQQNNSKLHRIYSTTPNKQNRESLAQTITIYISRRSKI